MKNIRLLALDLDGTALRSDGSLSEYNRTALMEAREAGIHIAAASGRSHVSLPDEILSLPCVEYAITSNGAVVYDMKRKERLQVYYLKAASVEGLLRIAEEAGVMVEGFLDGVPYSQHDYVEDPVRFGANPEAVAYVRRTRRPVEDIYSFLRFHKEELESLDLITGVPQKKEALRKRIQKEVKDIYLTSAVPMLLEASDSHGGKASGLAFLAGRLGIGSSEVAAFGNAENDLDMILWAGRGIAVANAPETVRMRADEETESNDEDGVGRWIRRYLQGRAKDGTFTIPGSGKQFIPDV